MKFLPAILFFICFSINADEALEKDINTALSGLIPDVSIDSIRETPVEGLYQVLIGADVVYITGDGNYVFKGELLDIKQRMNLTEDARVGARVALINDIDKNEYIEFAADDVQDAIYVFTDVDCGYCIKLHRDVNELNSRGVSVRYLAYPRAGIDSATGREMSDVWCADNRQAALTAAKNQEPVKAKSCSDPVAKQYELGQKMGLRGTPAIFLQDGRMLPGYMSPNELVNQLRP